MKTNWTAGPWVVHAKTDTAVVGGSGYVVAACGGHSNNQRDPTELAQELSSNARLISTAPELYEALDDLVNGNWPSPEHFVKARSVLAKARGE